MAQTKRQFEDRPKMLEDLKSVRFSALKNERKYEFTVSKIKIILLFVNCNYFRQKPKDQRMGIEQNSP